LPDLADQLRHGYRSKPMPPPFGSSRCCPSQDRVAGYGGRLVRARFEGCVTNGAGIIRRS